MIKQVKRAALYVRVSTDHQTLENQIHELTQIAERRGWEVVEIYKDHGISGAKGRDKRPGLDLMLTDASRRKFDVVMSWAIDRLGHSLIDLLGTIQHLEASTCTSISKRSTPRRQRASSCSKSRARSPSSSAR
jgi:DNA invertase Pin-like site-specific DNA recombinase